MHMTMALFTMVTAATSEPRDAAAVLQCANRALASRINSEVEFTTTSYTWSNEAWAQDDTAWGTWLFSSNRQRLVGVQTGSGEPARDRLYVYDGSITKILNTTQAGAARSGVVSAGPYVADAKECALLITGQLFEGGGKDGQAGSVFEHMLNQADKDTLEVEETEDADGRPVVRVVGEMPWGRYEIWIDPARGCNMIKFMADIADSNVPFKWSRFEVESIELVEFDGQWFPASATMIYIFEPDVELDPSLPKVYLQKIEMNIENVTLMAGDEPAELFDFDWPAGTQVTDSVAGFRYTQLKEGRLTNPLGRVKK